MRFRLLAPAALLAACAGAPARPALEADDLKELRSQLQAQSALVAQQQRRIEELEVKLAALAARTQAVPAHATPVRVDPRPPLKTVKVGGCTSCDTAACFSHRRDKGRTGRHLAFIQARDT